LFEIERAKIPFATQYLEQAADTAETRLESIFPASCLAENSADLTRLQRRQNCSVDRPEGLVRAGWTSTLATNKQADHGPEADQAGILLGCCGFS